MTAQSRTEIADLLARHGLSPIHRLGQNFLADANITRKIVNVAGVGKSDLVLEVGAGTGTLTRALAESGASVLAYEIDSGMEPVLRETTSGLDVDLRFQDIMAVDLAADLHEGIWRVVANLPYNIGTPFLLSALQERLEIVLFVVMVQREVAERICARPGGKEYGLPSVISQIHAEPRIEFKVPPQVFIPAPRVGSAVLVMPRKEAPSLAGRAVVLARAAFAKRRKMVRGALADVLDDAESDLEAAGIDPTCRAEDLSPDDYLRLAGL